MQKAVLDALVDEATRKSGLIWVGAAGEPPRPVRHIWHDGGAYLVVGGREQELPGVDVVQTVSVMVRSKDKGGRLVTWTAKPRQVVPDGDEWATVVSILHGKRLNAPRRRTATGALALGEPDLPAGADRTGRRAGPTRCRPVARPLHRWKARPPPDLCSCS